MGCSNSSASVVQPVGHQHLQVVTPAQNPSFCLRIPGRDELQKSIQPSTGILGAGESNNHQFHGPFCQLNPLDGSIVLAAEQRRELLCTCTMNFTDSPLPHGLFSAGSIQQHSIPDPHSRPQEEGLNAGILGSLSKDDEKFIKKPADQIVSGTGLQEDSAPLAVIQNSSQQQHHFPNQATSNLSKKEAGLSPIRIKHLKPRMSARHIPNQEASDIGNPRSRNHSHFMEADPASPNFTARQREDVSNPNILSRLRKFSDGLKPEDMNFSERGTSAGRFHLKSSARKPSDDSSNLFGSKKNVRGLSFSIASRETPERRNSENHDTRIILSLANQAKPELEDPRLKAETFGESLSNDAPSTGRLNKPEISSPHGALILSKGGDRQEYKRSLASNYSQSTIRMKSLRNSGNSEKVLEIKVLQKSKFSQLTPLTGKPPERLEKDHSEQKRLPIKPSSWPEPRNHNIDQPLNLIITRPEVHEANTSKSVASNRSTRNRKDHNDGKIIEDILKEDHTLPNKDSSIRDSSFQKIEKSIAATTIKNKQLLKLTNKPHRTIRIPPVSPRAEQESISEASDSIEENKVPIFCAKPLDCNEGQEDFSQLSASSSEE